MWTHHGDPYFPKASYLWDRDIQGTSPALEWCVHPSKHTHWETCEPTQTNIAEQPAKSWPMETSWVQGSLQLERMSSLTAGAAAPFPEVALPFPCPPWTYMKLQDSGKWPGRPDVPPSQGLVPSFSACWLAFRRQSLHWSRASSRAHALALWEELRPLWLVRVSEDTCAWKPLGQILLDL